MTRILIFTLFALLIQGCDSPQQQASGGMGELMGPDTGGYAEVIEGRTLSFPADHLAHDKFRQEWWYLTANLTTDTGKPLGLQWTQFRIALSPEAPTSDSPWATNQLYMAHGAITSPTKHQASELWSRGLDPIAGVQASPLTIALDDWRWQSVGEQLFPATLAVNGDDFRYQLQLTNTAPLQLQGDEGYSIKSKDGEVASYYYSQPFIDITGTVTLEGLTHKVTGQGWLDREWSSQFLTRQQQGWDWFALRLDDGSALMLFQLRSSAEPFYSARRMFADGSGHNIASHAITMTPSDWRQIDEASYPVGWQISIPSEQLQLNIAPLNPDSLMPLSVRYWEGPIQISGSHRGQGYMELTGY